MDKYELILKSRNILPSLYFLPATIYFLSLTESNLDLIANLAREWDTFFNVTIYLKKHW